MDVITLDFETYYADDYTLSKLSTEEYVRDPRFEMILVSLKINDGQPFWILEDRFRQFCAETDWSQVTLTGHHVHFDGLILSHHFGVKPAFWIDTLSMARVVDGPKAGNSLYDLCIRHGIGYKMDYILKAKNKRLADFTPGELFQYGEYCCNDTARTYDLAQIFLPQIPDKELRLIDVTVRMFTEPVFVGDQAKLAQAVTDEKARKAELYRRVGGLCDDCAGAGCAKCEQTGVSKKLFSSSDKFADVLRAFDVEPPMKLSPAAAKKGETEYIYAFAKSDPGMQELLEDDREEIRFLAEARIASKSTILETRAQRFLGAAQRGAMPVYLKYGAAHTWRFGGGDKTNWQNMTSHNAKRPEMTVLKQSVMAPPGHMVVRADASQIEARFTAWLAGQQDLVDAFAAGRDVYSEFAGDSLYMRPVDRKNNPADFIPGQLGKVCFAAGTRVVTHRGLVPIEQVQLTDTLWDGHEWVTHQGLLHQGERSVIWSAGVAATPDHEILTGRGWAAWREVTTSPSLFQSALNLASLPSQGGVWSKPPEESRSIGRCVDARAAAPLTLVAIHSNQAGLLDVTPAQRRHPVGSDINVISQRCRMKPTALDCLIAYPRRLRAAIIKTINTMRTTVSAAFSWLTSGALTARPFYTTSKLSPVGTLPHWTWIELMSTARMRQGTFDSVRVAKTHKINAKYAISNAGFNHSNLKCQTYDIACVGPRRRYTVVTDAGPIIVHNCVLGMGFGMGWFKFSLELLKGMLGAPPIQFKEDDLVTLQVDPSKFLNNPKKVKQVEAMISRLDMSDRLIHCCVADEIVQRYRRRYAMIPKLWDTHASVISAMIEGREMVWGPGGVLRTEGQAIVLPNGMRMNYRDISRSQDGEATYWNGRERTRIHGPKLTENEVQALARIPTTDALLSIADAGVKIATMCHDENVGVVPEEAADLALELFIHEMKVVPEWAPGLPLEAEGGIGRTYADAKYPSVAAYKEATSC